MSILYLIVGLGNPGIEYVNTRHNIGFIVVDAIASKYNAPQFATRFDANTTKLKNDAVIKAVLLKPMTYMNLSGKAVLQAAAFYKIPTERIIVIHDDIDLTCGKVKIKSGGNHAGHNGLKSISMLVGANYTRIRIGVSRPSNQSEVSQYVLSRFTDGQLHLVMQVVAHITAHLPKLLLGDRETFVQLCHTLKVE